MESAIDKVASLPLSDFNPRNKTIFFKCKVTTILPVMKGQKQTPKQKKKVTRLINFGACPALRKNYF
jgi:hypothetical protein